MEGGGGGSRGGERRHCIPLTRMEQEHSVSSDVMSASSTEVADSVFLSTETDTNLSD